MLKLVVPDRELFNEEDDTFIAVPGFTLRLEHSLVSLSKWESRFEKPFLNGKEKTQGEVVAYVEAMILDEDFPPDAFSRLTATELDKVNEYINAKMTATTFNTRTPERPSREMITAELIYYWMVAYQIDWEAQYWHLNKLLTLIKVCNIKNAPPKNAGKAQGAADRRRMNAERRAKLGTKG